MSDSIIKVNNLSKKYLINHKQERYTVLRDVIANKVKSLGRKKLETGETEEFWALKDISFNIKQGDRVGIIGRNGAGKSTLLKLLSRITEPTTGSITINGRVTSLLEVGTGFHPELTGRENVFLNGAILGMSRAEIKQRFDEIVEFAEVQQFLDTPVKRYSSGMYVRLAFSVAAHLEPEILIVDEVLAVGDAQFQKKCLGKMSDVSREGRTILFVSHNISAVYQLCNKSILLNKGQILFDGAVKEGIDKYIAMNTQMGGSIDLSDNKNRKGNGDIKVEWIKVLNKNNEECSEFFVGDDIFIQYGIKRYNKNQHSLKLSIEIKRSDGLPIANILDTDSHFEIDGLNDEEIITIRLRDIRIYPESYYITFCCISKDCNVLYDYIQDIATFSIIGGGIITSRNLPTSSGTIFLTPEWSKKGENIS